MRKDRKNWWTSPRASDGPPGTVCWLADKICETNCPFSRKRLFCFARIVLAAERRRLVRFFCFIRFPQICHKHITVQKKSRPRMRGSFRRSEIVIYFITDVDDFRRNLKCDLFGTNDDFGQPLCNLVVFRKRIENNCLFGVFFPSLVGNVHWTASDAMRHACIYEIYFVTSELLFTRIDERLFNCVQNVLTFVMY